MAYRLLHPADLEGLVSMDDAIEGVGAAYGAVAQSPMIGAPRRRVHSPAGVRVSVFPGGVPALGVIGVGEHAELVKHDGPVQHTTREHQVWLLHDGETAKLRGVMIGAVNEKTVGYTCQTALRTGATSGVGFKHLARNDATTVGMFGTGHHAVTQLMALTRVRPIRQAKIFSRNEENRRAFAEKYGPLFGIEIAPVDTPEEVVRGTDVVICATNTNVPVLMGDWLEPGQHVTSIVGSNIALVKAGWLDARRREVDNRTVERADVIAANNIEAVMQDEQGDLFEPIEAGIIAIEDIIELGHLVNGTHPGRTSDDQITLHKNNMGTGVADIAVAMCAYQRAEAAGRGTGMELPEV